MDSPEFTPMMRQYRELKQRYPDHVLLFRLGDFYEMFFEDAELGARTLQIALTSRQKGEGRIPMAGIPHHAAESYIGRLLHAGLKIAVCEQMESPGKGKSLLRREVTRILTPGTVTDAAFLDRSRNNFLLSLWMGREGVGAALVDVGTAEFWVGEEAAPAQALVDAILLRQPAEVLVSSTLDPALPLVNRLRDGGATITLRDPSTFQLKPGQLLLLHQFQVQDLAAFGLGGMTWGVQAAAAALLYLKETQGETLPHLTRLQCLKIHEAMVLDETAVRTLELVETIHDRSVRGSLYGALNQCFTPMGARLLRQWLLRPLLLSSEIESRQDAIQEWVDAPALRSQLQQALASIGDLERLTSRISLGLAHARDLIGLRESLRRLPTLRAALEGSRAVLLQEMTSALADLSSLQKLLEAALEDDPPLTLHEGRLIREGFNQALADLKREAREARAWILGLEARERRATGIGSLKVRFNRVFGYGIEVSNANLALVPLHYIRRQTLAGGERFVTPELKGYEEKVLGAEERVRQLELEIFEQVRADVAKEALALFRTARAVAVLDLLQSLAEVASSRRYVRPVVDVGAALEIVDGRHPVLELMSDRPFVPNDIALDGESVQCMILTGPNMAGKSTYMRQIALTVIMAQIGSFVPAREAKISVADRIFTRVGAMDNLSKGQSTFLVEMMETANILHNATANSLILLDEVGRGTSTFDGLAIAWAVIESLHERTAGAKVLFATHYHELTQLAERLQRVKNYHVAVREWNEEIIFLHKVRPGGTDRSYGIQVARLAGLPAAVIRRARELLARLEGGDCLGDIQSNASTPTQLGLFPAAAHPVLEELFSLDLANVTPLRALTLMSEWQARLKER
jgi:DNA mismatch repair protein MutS